MSKLQIFDHNLNPIKIQDSPALMDKNSFPYILVHPTKTGGVSILNALVEEDVPIFVSGHECLNECLDTHAIILLTRNPYTRVWSQYNFFKKKWGCLHEVSFSTFVLYYPYRKDSILRDVLEHGHPTLMNTISSMVTCRKIKDINRIIRFEHLQEDFSALCTSLGINNNLSHRNQQEYSSKFSMSLFTADMLKRINEYFKEDFKNFGYEMIVREENNNDQQSKRI